MKKSRLIMALGSNCRREENMKKAENMIYRLFNGDVSFTRTMLTRPIGFESDLFLNRLAIAHTALNLDTVERALKAIECECGRKKEDKSRNIVKMDIDILQYDEHIFHAEDRQRGYIKELLTEIEGLI